MRNDLEQKHERFFRKLMVGFIAVMVVSFALLFFSSCRSSKWATKKIAVIEQKQPKVLADYCGTKYPAIVFDSTRIEYVEGQTSFVVDTVVVDCDSVMKGSVITKVVRVPCPPSSARVDTIISSRTVQVENKAKIEALTLEVADYKVKLEEAEEGRNTWRWIAIAALALIVVSLIIRIVRGR